ncbi:recombinase family protein [Rhizobium sp. GCM10022189]|uniref:recombinase family protein n=1 Tax=Rhizobium sp. GCM10022189 TaxID=3252654 RepID=UPI003612B206
MTKTVLFYAHCAADRPHELPTETQIELGTEFIRKQGWKLVEVFTDHMVSGATDKTRPGIQALRDRTAEGDIDVVLCISMDHLSCDMAHSLEIHSEFRNRGVEVWTMAGDAPVTDLGLSIRALLGREIEQQSRYRARLLAVDDIHSVSVAQFPTATQ